MDQFKKAQEIAKKSQELQTELAAAEFEGASSDGSVTFKMNGQQQPVSAAAPGFDGMDAEALSKAFSEAMADAQAKSLQAMNEKMLALYASVGMGGALGDEASSSMGDLSKFITPNLNRVKHGNVAASPKSTKDPNAPTIADREEKQAMQKLLADDNSNPITLSAIGIGLFSLATMLGVRLQRGLQPATVLASSGGLGPVMPMNTASALGDNVMEMKSQEPNTTNRVGWGQLSAQQAAPRTVAHAKNVLFGDESRAQLVA